jgi:hypothetical protein
MSILSTGLSNDERRAAGGLKPLAISVRDTCRVTGLKATKIWQLIRDGRLEVVRVDGRTLVKYPSVEQLLSPHADAQPAPRRTPRRKRVTPAGGAEAR